MIYNIGILMFTTVAMLVLFELKYVYIVAILYGISSGLVFSLSIVFFSLKSKTTTGTLKISGKAQSVGYLIAAFGPPVFWMVTRLGYIL